MAFYKKMETLSTAGIATVTIHVNTFKSSMLAC